MSFDSSRASQRVPGNSEATTNTTTVSVDVTRSVCVRASKSAAYIAAVGDEREIDLLAAVQLLAGGLADRREDREKASPTTAAGDGTPLRCQFVTQLRHVGRGRGRVRRALGRPESRCGGLGER